MKHLLFKLQSFLVLLVFTAASAYAQKSPVDMNRFIDDLMKKMTLEEKIGQLNLPVTGEITTGQAKSSNVAKRIRAGEVGGLFNLKGVERIRDVQKQAVEESRLGIPLLFGMDVIHGYETVFPIPLGLSCTWDMKAVEESARIAAIESSADGICWTFSPMVDICRDARWGRVSEGNGEDPFLGAAIAQAMVRGYQGKDMSRNDEIMACVKHFALYGAGEAGRDYNTVDMSHQRMFNEYMLPYQAAVDAGVGSAMASFNEVDGIPATGNKWLMTDVLRKQWGFDGFVVTDYTGITEMTDHGMGDTQTVAALALNAGVDMDMVSDAFTSTLKKSLEEGNGVLIIHDHMLTPEQQKLADEAIGEPVYFKTLLSREDAILRKEQSNSENKEKQQEDEFPQKESETFTLCGYLDRQSDDFPEIHQSWHGEGSLYYFISEKGFQKIPTEKKILTMELTADPEKEPYVKTQISELISEENKKRSEMTEVSMDEGTGEAGVFVICKSDLMQQKETYMRGNRILLGAVSIILFIAGLTNYCNVVFTGMYARRKEFDVMKSIGMTDKQMKLMFFRVVAPALFYFQQSDGAVRLPLIC